MKYEIYSDGKAVRLVPTSRAEQTDLYMFFKNLQTQNRSERLYLTYMAGSFATPTEAEMSKGGGRYKEVTLGVQTIDELRASLQPQTNPRRRKSKILNL